MSKRSNACEIPKKVKDIVWKRDKHKCIICGKPGLPNAHFIKRSQGGLGIEQNIVTLCPQCHFEEDFGKNTKDYEKKIEEYLKSKYENWNKNNLIYNKWKY